MEALVAVRRPRTYRRSDGYHAPVADRSENVQDWRGTLSRLLCDLRLSPQGADARRVWWTSCGRRSGLWRRRTRRAGWVLWAATNRMDGYSRLHEGISAKRPTNRSEEHTSELQSR